MKSGKFPQLLLLLGIGYFMTGCVAEKEQARHFLSQKGLEVTTESLFQAVENGDDEIALALLESGVEFSSKNANGRSLLAEAASKARTRVLWQILPEKATSPDQDAEGLSTLVHAARANEIWFVKELLKRGADPNVKLPDGGTLVAESLEQGRYAIAKLLLETGADIESCNAKEERLVTIAARSGASWMVEDLVQRGTAFNSKNDQGQSLAHIIAEAGRPELVSFLTSQGANLAILNDAGENPIHVAVSHGSSDVIESFAKAGVSLDDPDQIGNRPLHLAVMRRDPGSIRELLRLGADPNLPSTNGLRPIDYALEMRDYDFASLLLQYNAKLDGLLAPALESEDLDLINFILANGADPNESNGLEKDCPLGIALRKGNSAASLKLVEAGAKHDAMTKEGQTAFHLAMARLDKPVIKALLENGADPNEPFIDYPSKEFLELIASKNISKWSLSNDRGFRPLMMAADCGDVELVKMLLEHGADTKVYTTRRNWYPISWAARRGDVETMQILLGRKPEEVTRWAKVDLSEQRATVYDGEKEIYTTRVSTGKPGHRTKTGTFVITNRLRHWNSTLYGSSMPYFQRFSCGDFGFHQGVVPGYPASHGCIRVPAGNVRKLWEILTLGDVVKIVP